MTLKTLSLDCLAEFIIKPLVSKQFKLHVVRVKRFISVLIARVAMSETPHRKPMLSQVASCDPRIVVFLNSENPET